MGEASLKEEEEGVSSVEIGVWAKRAAFDAYLGWVMTTRCLDDWASTPAYWRTSGPVPYTLTHSSAPSPILPISIRSGMAPITLARAAVARMALQLTVQ